VLHQRGRWFQHTGDLAEAISFYNQALMIAANPAALETDLQDAQTALAFQHLKAQRWEAAEKIYRDCLNQAPNYTDQVGKIRRDFKSCSDFYLEQSPPEWDIAYQVLSYLRKLGLDNESVFQWRQLIIIQKMKAAFAQNQPETAFALLPRLEGAWPKEILQHIIKEYCQAQTSSEVDNWLAAVDALKQFASLVSDTDIFARRWIVQELLAVADLLEEQGKLSEAQIAIELAMAYNDKELLTSPAS
jgi:tetratricopeptide (TPR) repeat protein